MTTDEFWHSFGYRKNPYKFTALSVSSDDRKLYVERGEPERYLKMLVCCDGGEIIVVDGRVGVGKTSTVNAVQYDKWRTEKYFRDDFHSLCFLS